MSQSKIDQITTAIARRFRCFGSGQASIGNPLSAALADGPPMFALGVDVAQVVRAVVEEMREPTLNMVRAGARKAREMPQRELADEYTAMIDALLAETK